MPVTSGLDPAWLGGVMAARGAGTPSAALAGFVGTGQMSRVVRYHLAWAAGSNGPSSVLVKVPSSVRSTREMAFTRGFYRRECEFYRSVSPQTDVATPEAYHVHYDDDTLDFAIVMEDVAPHTAGDQLGGVSVADVEAALTEAAALHAGCWGRMAEVTFDAYREDVEAEVARTERGFPAMVDEVLSRWAEVIEPEVVDFVRRLLPVIGPWRRLRSRPDTLAHGDFRPDNLLFDPAAVSRPVVAVDWQLATPAPPALDVAFLIGGAFSPEQRRGVESSLTTTYLGSMASLGVELDEAEFMADYAIATVHGIVVSVGAAAMVDRTDRGEELLSMMLNRHGRHALDWNTFDLIEDNAITGGEC